MQELRKKAVEKLESDMIFVFECDEEEKAQAYNCIMNMSRAELLGYINS